MNIFASFSCPVASARYLDNRRVVKMILESAQMLSVAINVHGGSGFYKDAHFKHPCTIWTRESRENYEWLYEHMIALIKEYKYRYDKNHHCIQYVNIIEKNRHILPSKGLTKFANCARAIDKGIDFSHITDTHLAYRLYLHTKWNNIDKIPASCHFRY